MTFAIVGYGTVGRATRAAAEWHGHECVAIVDCADIVGEIIEDETNQATPRINWANPDAKLRIAEFAFVCVDTPSNEDGSCDVSNVYAAVGDLVERGYTGTVVVRSTVPPGALADLEARHLEALHGRLLHCPEFLRVRDIEHTSRWPNFVVIGAPHRNTTWERNPRARALRRFFLPFFDHRDGAPVFLTDWNTSALTKYASNALIALTIAGAEQLFDVAQAHEANWKTVESILQHCTATPKTIRVDPEDRGFGGACLPKDLHALLRFGPLEKVDLFAKARIINHGMRETDG